MCDMKIRISRILAATLLFFLQLSLSSGAYDKENHEVVVVRPQEYSGALRNPLKGFRPGKRDGGHEYGTLCRTYLKWNQLEDKESDGINRIKAVCDKEWKDVEKHNIKVIPRVYLHWDGDKKYWPSDMQEDDYSSDQFKKRLFRLISRLGECWNNDPRVAWVQMGIIGKWGEHHSPSVSPEMQKLLGDAFTEAFPNKMVTVRHSWDFKDYEFGIYWDSWAHIQQMETHGAGIEKLGTRWHTRPVGGECAYNWGNWKEQPGDDPNDTLRDPKHRSFLIDSIRRFHCNNLGWVAEYDSGDPKVRAGAEEVQKTFGYRLILEQFEYPAETNPGDAFDIVFKVRNSGSSPFYADWPVEISLLDPRTREIAWRDTVKDLDIRRWLPGDRWETDMQAYQQLPDTYKVHGRFVIPEQLERKEYIIAIAILDPAGMLPAVRFAVKNYFTGGRHPLGRMGVGVSVTTPLLDPTTFDDPAKDTSLCYTLHNGS